MPEPSDSIDCPRIIPVYKPWLPPDSLVHARAALDSGWLSSRGKFPHAAAEKLAAVTGARHVLLVNSGTAATHLLSCALRFRYPGVRHLWVPNNVYVAAWNAFLHDEHFHLKPVDADLSTWNVDIANLTGSSAEDDALLIVHNLGNVVNVPALRRRFPNAAVVEDCCESFLGAYEGMCTGTQCLASSLSFYANKTITSGEGGAVLTNDTEVYEHLRLIANQGQDGEPFLHTLAGYNYRMTNVQAAVLLGQLDVLPDILERKTAVFQRYEALLGGHDFVRMQVAPADTSHAKWMFGVRILGSPGYRVAESYFRECGVEIRPMFHPISSHDHLRKLGAYPDENARTLHRECVILPSYPALSSEEISHVAATVLSFGREHCFPYSSTFARAAIC